MSADESDALGTDRMETDTSENRHCRRSSSPSYSDSNPIPSKRQKQIVSLSDDDSDDDDDQFESVGNVLSYPQAATRTEASDGYGSDDSLPELGTVELTVGDATMSVLAPRARKRRAAVTKRARTVRRCHHMADLMCQVSGAQVMNQVCRAESVVARCLSLVSPFAASRIAEHLVPGKAEIRREWASSDLHYFLSSYQALKIKTGKGGSGGRSVLQEFVSFLESRVATRPWHQPMLLTGMLRALSFDARLCVGLAPVPLKITAQESAALEKRLAESAAVDISLMPATMVAHVDDVATAVLEPAAKRNPGSARQEAAAEPQYWSEVFDQVSERWLAVDAYTGTVERATQMQRSGKAPAYIVALDNQGFMRDITRRYTNDFVNTTLRQRLEGVDAATDAYARVWWAQWISRWESPDASNRDEKEDAEMERSAMHSTMPKRISDFATNPYYVLARNLNQNEVIHPPEPVVGTVRGEPVYLRENVRTLRSRMAWMREGRVVRPGAAPVKSVKKRTVTARARMAADAEVAAGREPVSELFGEWQTDLFKPPPVSDGCVPRNEYGRIDLFKPTMLPAGAAHVRDAEAKHVCKELGIDAVDAVVGFEFRRGASTPVLVGVVIPETSLDLVKDAMAEHRRNARDKLRQSIEQRALKRWRRLLVALRVREEVDASFASRSARDDSAVITFGAKAKRKTSVPDADPDTHVSD
ncbi:hypothetical protein LPJ59_000146 [Coemansia sp. RSA 2399]|nr:hypothetical protein LPJ59_000146 [Coemansia sp. RSA 2399]KAJ1907062.1 hypothetical protein LPJ81_000998 [Coemansia sp. IMI 209127]